MQYKIGEMLGMIGQGSPGELWVGVIRHKCLTWGAHFIGCKYIILNSTNFEIFEENLIVYYHPQL